ncbi:hypothetical protein [Cellulomonas sp. URHB0016]
MLTFPQPLKHGDRIGVTSPSSDVEGHAADRIAFCVDEPVIDDRIVLTVPQTDGVDSVDRVQLGAALVQQLVAAGL